MEHSGHESDSSEKHGKEGTELNKYGEQPGNILLYKQPLTRADVASEVAYIRLVFANMDRKCDSKTSLKIYNCIHFIRYDKIRFLESIILSDLYQQTLAEIV